MKVCHIITDLDVGGAELMLKRLVQYSYPNKSNVTIISLTSLGKIGECLRSDGYNVETINLSKWGFLVFSIWKLVRLLKRINPDIVQTWMYHADIIGGISARIAGCKNVVWGIHSTFLPIGKPFTKIVMKICAISSGYVPNNIVCVAEKSREMHIKYGYEAEKMVVIPNGFDLTEVNNVELVREEKREELGILSSEFVIGSVGRFHPDKGQDLLLIAFSQIVRSIPSVKLVLAGRGCSLDNTYLVSQLKELEIENLVLLLGEREDVSELLLAFDAYCMPSRTEAFPVALGEAMFAGLPSVATNVGDTAILTGDASLLVNVIDADHLAEALQALLAMPATQLSELGFKARCRIRDLFSLRKMCDRYQDLYNEIYSIR